MRAQVGSHYKNPVFPVWVVGSTSHFSVLFSHDAASNEQSPSSKALRAFSKYDEYSNRFIDVSHLRAVLSDLGATMCWVCAPAGPVLGVRG